MLAHGGTPTSIAVCLCSLLQSDDPLVQHHELLPYHHVFVVMPEEPVLEPALCPILVEEVGQNIPLVQVSAEHLLDAARAAV